jgi:inner membrane protein
VENLAHTLVGGALGRAGLDRLTPLAMPTVLIAANLPDVDAVAGFWGGLAYLEHHRGVTHSILGVVCEAPLLAGAMFVFDRLVRRSPAATRARFWPLLLVAFCGLASHPLLDYTNSYGIRPWLPFASSWVYGDLVFIVDPLLWLVLAGGLVLGTDGKRGLVGWAMLAFVLSVAVLRVNVVPSGMKVFWVAAVTTFVLCRWWRQWDSAVAARLALVGLIAYWGALSAAHARAVTLARCSAPAGDLAALPELGNPFRWRAFVETSATVYVGDVALFGRPEQLRWQAVARHLDEPEVRRAEATYAGCVMRDFGRYLVADMIPDGGQRTVVLTDVRFARPGRPGFASVRIPLDGAAGAAVRSQASRRPRRRRKEAQ